MEKILKKVEGNILAIGLDENYSNIILKNKKVNNFDLLELEVKKHKTGKSNSKKKLKKIVLKKLHKYYKKNDFDYIICNFDVLNKNFINFVNNTIKIGKNKVVFYNVSSEKVKRNYLRYKALIKEEKDIIEIDISKAKKKSILFPIKLVEGVIELIDLIGLALLS